MRLHCWFPLVCLVSIGVVHAQVQRDAPAVNVEAILRDLDKIESAQKATVASARQAAVNHIIAAAGNGATAADMYEKAVEATQFEGIQNKGGSFAAWKKNVAPVLRTKELQTALLLHLRYLALSIQRKASDDAEPFVQPSLNYASDLAAADTAFLKQVKDLQAGPTSARDRQQQQIEREAMKIRNDLLGKPLTESIFVKWLRLGSAIPQGDDWELVAGDLAGILEKNVRPGLRESKNPSLLATHDMEMKVMADRVSLSDRDHDADSFNTRTLPRMQIARANDLVVLGQNNRAITEIYTLVKTYPQHPDFKSWVARLRELLTPAAPEAEETPTPAAASEG